MGYHFRRWRRAALLRLLLLVVLLRLLVVDWEFGSVRRSLRWEWWFVEKVESAAAVIVVVSGRLTGLEVVSVLQDGQFAR